MRILLTTLIILTPLLAGAAENTFQQDRFAIGLWVDPPMDAQAEARYAALAEANFTLVIGGFGARSPEQVDQQLELCAKYDMAALVASDGIAADQLPESPACWGYRIKDEPSAADFPELRKRVDELRAARPGKLGYINLFPNYASPEQLGAADYEEHVRRFIDEVGVEVLSMDHYPYMRPDKDTRQNYCDNLAVMRKYALKANIPFWNYFNTMPYGGHYDPTEAQLRWQVNASVAYGAKGVLYFCYYTPRGGEFPKGGAIISVDDKPTRHYDQAKRINAKLKAFGPTLMQLTSTAVYRIAREEDATAALNNTPITAIEDGAWLLGLFDHADGRRALYLVNDDYAYTAWPTVAFDCPIEAVREIDPQSGAEGPVYDNSPDMEGLQISLDSGDARLFLLPAH